jgi:uncharacterized membrane protein YgdD (TMEM256/DUF423 family)
MKPNFTSIGATCAALGVAFGAFGAHGLRNRVDASQLGIWESATRYLLVGALGTLLFGLSQDKSERSALPGWLLLVGSILFAGSLYALVLGAPRLVGAITPFGGLGLIGGFAAFAISARRRS